MKVRKWRSIFNLGRSGHETKRKFPRGAEDRGKFGVREGPSGVGVPGPGPTHPRLAEDRADTGTLRPAKSMDSLSAGAGPGDGECRVPGACTGLGICMWSPSVRAAVL